MRVKVLSTAPVFPDPQAGPLPCTWCNSWQHESLCAVVQEAVQAVKYYAEKRAEWNAATQAAHEQLQQHTQQRDDLQRQAEQVRNPPDLSDLTPWYLMRCL